MNTTFILDIVLKEGFILIQNKHLDYSTMRENGVDSRYEKDGVIFIWGLHEKDKPPTLISPRPNISKTILQTFKDINGVVKQYESKLDQQYDDIMNECLNTFNHQDIFNSIISKDNKLFCLDTKTIKSFK